MQFAPLFFHDLDIGVDLLPAALGVNGSALVDTIRDPKGFFSDPPGLAPLATYCNHTMNETEWGSDRCWTVSGQFRPAHNAIRLDRVWAPSPWVMGEGAARAGRHEVASDFTAATLNTVYSVMDKRGREPNLPLPGNAYECWDTAMMDKSLPKVSSYAMAEAYGWSSIATVLLIRTVIGFRDGAGSATPAFELAPALPRELLLGNSNQDGGCRPLTFGIERLGFHGKAFSVLYRYRACEQGNGVAAVDTEHDDLVPAVRLEVEVHEMGAAGPRARFDAVNGQRYTVGVQGDEGGWTVAAV